MSRQHCQLIPTNQDFDPRIFWDPLCTSLQMSSYNGPGINNEIRISSGGPEIRPPTTHHNANLRCITLMWRREDNQFEIIDQSLEHFADSRTDIYSSLDCHLTQTCMESCLFTCMSRQTSWGWLVFSLQWIRVSSKSKMIVIMLSRFFLSETFFARISEASAHFKNCEKYIPW